MDVTSDIFTTILSPLAAFLPDPPPRNSTSSSVAATLRDGRRSHDIATNHDNPPRTTNRSPSPPVAAAAATPAAQPHPPSPAPPGTDPSPAQPPPSSRVTTWRVDAISLTARRFLAVPSFALGRPPLRIDVYVPAAEDFPARLRAAVGPERAVWDRRCHRRRRRRRRRPRRRDGGDAGRDGDGDGDWDGHGDGDGVGGLEVSRWLVRVLERWSAGVEGAVLEERWWGMPFGSAVVVGFEDDDDDAGVRVDLVPEYGVEQGMVGVERLRRMWAGEVDEGAWEGVEVVEWERLRFRRQVHEVISLVEVEGMEGKGHVVFKSVLRDQAYMYNELKMLLVLGGHPNIMSRPIGVVTKKGRFGNRRGVCGFLLEWLPLGSLRDKLLQEDYLRTTSMAQRFRWATQITEALAHVNRLERAGFYPDLKPDNIVLREDVDSGMLDAVLIDFEQRGGWFAWSPPEVAYVEYLEWLADESGLPAGDLRNEITAQLSEYHDVADWSPGKPARRRYLNSEELFSGPWLSLLRERRQGGQGKDSLERAQVFMLGKLLWCIFEGQPLVRCGIDHELLRDPDPDNEPTASERPRAFPEFKNTPSEVQPLICACTAGAPEWQADADGEKRQPGLVLRSGKLYPAAAGGSIGDVLPEDTLEAARRYWRNEVEQARRFMEHALRRKRGETAESFRLLDLILARPLFKDVLVELERTREKVCSSAS
ncbi:hypothetical protein VTK26DRAFT_8181 [Humicola hyalothermophila]